MMKQVQVKITTKSPVVLAAASGAAVMTATNEVFSGTVLRGLAAARYIAAAGLGKAAHKDAAFRSLFFGQLRFVDAFLLSADGQRSFPVPMSLQRSKDGSRLLDLLRDEPQPGFKSIHGLGCIDAQGGFSRIAPQKSISLHMSRSSEDERLAGKSRDGNIYNYESLDAGQTFCGNICGEESALQQLMEQTGSSWTAYVGRSHYTQYGECQIELSELQDVESEQVPAVGQAVVLRLETPFIPWSDERTEAAGMLAELADKMNAAAGENLFHVDSKTIFSGKTVVDNFVGVWQLRRPRVSALAAGSVFRLVKETGWTDADQSNLAGILCQGIGQRTAEGFGTLRIWSCQSLTPAEAKPVSGKADIVIQQPEVKKKAAAILRLKCLDQVRAFAAADARQAAGSIPKDATHMLSRLDGLLSRTKETAATGFPSLLERECRDDSTPFVRHLEAIRIDGRKLRDILKGNLADMPYQVRLADSIQKEDRKIGELYQELGMNSSLTKDSLVFYEYWHWFFRHGRKQVNTKGGVEA
ncbi:MAG: hypothetical protein LKE51_12890 [Selenomonas sp.]|jgi:CRISPR-associated protein Csx10|nr:hypothetical protein [Selenomonas sp.]